MGPLNHLIVFFAAFDVLISSISAFTPIPFDDRIVGGVQVRPNELPYQVSLQNSGRHSCGGVIIDENFILTAAHCFPLAYLTVVAGEHNLEVDEGNEQVRNVRSVRIHPGYDRGTMLNDIALLELDTPLAFNSAVNKINLPDASYDGTGFGVVSGWGRVEVDGSLATVLRKVSVPLMADATCAVYYGPNSESPATIYPSMLCAGFEEGGKDSCQGDSGGPLAVGFDEERYLAGIVSWGYKCGWPNYPGVYTEVSYFLDWIAQNTVPQ